MLVGAGNLADRAWHGDVDFVHIVLHHDACRYVIKESTIFKNAEILRCVAIKSTIRSNFLRESVPLKKFDGFL